jgi:4a-hydroxytetrahydrobiopterin dehydratase
MNLSDKKCIPCHVSPTTGTIKPMARKEVDKYLVEVPGWEVDEDNSMISQRFTFPDFSHTMSFVNHIAELAELEKHHPDIHIFYDHIDVDIWTHAIGGLHENDFILAAKINSIIS